MEIERRFRRRERIRASDVIEENITEKIRFNNKCENDEIERKKQKTTRDKGTVQTSDNDEEIL